MSEGGTAAGRARGALVWEWPVRVFHWGLVALLIALYVTAEQDWMDYHQWCGISVLALVLFRIGWGFVGGRYARFASFVHSPAAIARYARGLLDRSSSPTAGHSPLGGLSVVALLALLLAQGTTGLFSTDDVVFEGPLMQFVSLDTAETLTGIHHTTFDILLVFIGLHVAAVLFYQLYKRQNLVGAMLTGRKPVDQEDVRFSAWRLLLSLLLPAIAVSVLIAV